MSTDTATRRQVRTQTDHSVGDIVTDRERDSDPAVVVNIPGERCRDWYLDAGGTVAGDNPEYPADAPVVCVVFEDRLREQYPTYLGHEPLALATLGQQGIPWYAFPGPRLAPVEREDTIPVALDRLDPAPWHARTFSTDGNEAFIQRIGAYGLENRPLVGRVVDDRVELINGHKRAWAAHVGGRETVPVRCFRMTDRAAARSFARHHLPEYTETERATALDRLQAEFPADVVADILPAEVSG